MLIDNLVLNDFMSWTLFFFNYTCNYSFIYGLVDSGKNVSLLRGEYYSRKFELNNFLN